MRMSEYDRLMAIERCPVWLKYLEARLVSSKESDPQNKYAILKRLSMEGRAAGGNRVNLLFTIILKALGIRINGPKKRSSKGARTWRQAAQAQSHGQIMYEGLKREMSGRAGDRVGALLLQGCKQTPLTRDLPSKVIKYIHKESIKGRRAAGIAEDLHKMLPGITKEEIERISQTVVSKASTALTRARAEELYLNWYRWRSCKDARVRESHRLMDGVLISWTDAPEITGFNHAGEEDACRCYCEPLLGLDQVTWPAKICKNGCIETMTKAQFKRIQPKGSQLK